MNTNYRETNTDLLRLDSYARKLIKKEIRSYEVSLWTLQDDFITVLKWSDVEQKGRIEKPIFTINIDGTEKLTFSIPMYYRVKGKLIENPNWYNTLNKNLITGLRKLKVIFNKGDTEEEVFEFLITKVSEDHEKDILTCNVEAEGLAFLELGKLGYKISLSLEHFELLYKDWAEKGQWFITGSSTSLTKEPLLTIDYWCAEAGIEKLPRSLSEIPENISLINPRKWYYTVEMNWKSFDKYTLRDSKKMYEEPYTSSWTNDLTPKKLEEYREKARAVSIEKSNLYNITLNIAEKFEVFCRYVYLHDENYHIAGRIIVFYNNFLLEDNGLISFTYPYSSSKVNRTMECADVTTKLFVLNAEDLTTLEGYNTIMNSPANASKEDYILNFDYMLLTKAINLELYDYIKEYEKKMANFNKRLNIALNKKNGYEISLPKIKAKVTISENSIKLDTEQVHLNLELLNALDGLYGHEMNGYIEITADRPDYFLLLKNQEGKSFVNLSNTNKGIVLDTIHIYNRYHLSGSGPLLTNEIKDFEVHHDDNGNISEIEFLNNSELILADNTDINWAGVFEDCYKPEQYDGNVSLINRKIVPAEKFIEAGYDNFDGEYGTLYSSIITNAAKGGKRYDIWYTPIMADGTVLSLAEMETYLNSIINSKTTIDEWKSKDAKKKKLILHIALEAADHSTDPWGEALHNLQEEWDKIRAKNNWFGLQANPANISFEDIDYDEDLSASVKASIARHTSGTREESTKVYITYNYDPHLYYEKIIQTWERKLAKDTEIYNSSSDELDALELALESATDAINALMSEKDAEVHTLEHIMGPALREGYWLPENYNDYGDHHSIIANTGTTVSDENVILKWDTTLFEDEQALTYEIGVDLQLNYYPCINLDKIFSEGVPTDLDLYSILWKANDYASDFNDIKNLLVFAVNSLALIRFLYYLGTLTPVLVVIGAKTLSEDLITRMINTGIIEKYSAHVNEERVIIKTHEDTRVINGNWIFYPNPPEEMPENITQAFLGEILNTKDRELAYYRAEFISLALKTSSDLLIIKYNDHLLNLAEDYYINTREVEKVENNDSYQEMHYFITIKPESLIKYGYNDTNLITINYVLSNANTSIYLDALKVSKENAYPKVSYEVNVNVINETLAHTLYKRLALVVMINDTELKFENVFGYISLLELDLDNVLNDKVEVKNYKTKFEDLFSTIVALTESLKRAGTSLGAAMSGMVPMEGETFSTTLDMNTTILQGYLDSYFDSSLVVKDKLTSLFDAAGLILADSNKALDAISVLTNDNMEILSGLALNVMEELNPTIFRLAEKPVTFKVGDVWINPEENSRYIAISSSADSKPGGTFGFTKTYDGSLASIVGASLDIDADSGIINVKAQNEINIKSGNNIYIAANEKIDIVGNREVNIGGTTINIASTIDENGIMTGLVGGINIVSTAYNSNEEDFKKNTIDNLSKVLIHPEEVYIASSKLTMKGSAIEMIVSDGLPTSTAALKLDPDEGIWIGSGKKVALFAGADSSGANVQLTPQLILMGISNSNLASVFQLVPDYLLFSTGATTNINEISSKNIALNANNTSLTGVKLTKDSFGMAIDTGNTRTVILANEDGITLGAGDTPIISGSYVKISGSNGIELGSLADLYINTNNFKLLTNSETNALGELISKQTVFAIGNDLLTIGTETLVLGGRFYNKNENNLLVEIKVGDVSPSVNFMVNKSGAYINGTVYATAGSFTGDITANSLHLVSPNGLADIDDFYNYITTLQSLVDGEIDTWFGDNDPLPHDATLYNGSNNKNASPNEPASNWSNNTEKERHVGDIYYNNRTGQSFRWVRDTINGPYYWISIGNTELSQLLTSVLNVVNGNTGLAFMNSNNNTFVSLNKESGLVIMGNKLTSGTYINKYPFFRATNNAMGFFYSDSTSAAATLSNNDIPMLYFEDGDLCIAGTLFANEIRVNNGTTTQTWTNYFNSLISSQTPDVTPTLKSIFDEAGKILTNALSSITSVNSLIGLNKGVLDEFIRQAKKALTTTIEWCVASGSDNNPTYTSAVRIDPNEGIWMGSTKAIKFFSSFPTTSDLSGATLDIAPECILLGALSGTNSASVSIKPSLILLAVSGVAATGATTHITETTTTSGVLIQKDYIGMATGTGNDRSLVSLSPSRILIGTGFTADPGAGLTINGSYILIENKVIDSSTTPVTRAACFEIGSTGLFKILSPTLTINNNATSTDKMLYIGTDVDWKDADSALLFTLTDGLQMKAKSLCVNSGNTEILSLSGFIRFSGRRVDIKTTLPGTSLSSETVLDLINQGYLIGDLIEIRDSEHLSGVPNGLYELVLDASIAETGLGWQEHEISGMTDDEYNNFIAEKTEVSFSLDRNGNLICRSIVCFGDIICNGTIYSPNSLSLILNDLSGVIASNLNLFTGPSGTVFFY